MLGTCLLQAEEKSKVECPEKSQLQDPGGTQTEG